MARVYMLINMISYLAGEQMNNHGTRFKMIKHIYNQLSFLVSYGSSFIIHGIYDLNLSYGMIEESRDVKSFWGKY